VNFDSEKKLDLEDVFDLFQSKFGGRSFKLVVNSSFKSIYNYKKDSTQDSFNLNLIHPENSIIYFYKYSNSGVLNFIYNNISKFSDCIDFTNLCMYRFSMKRLKQSYIKYIENASMDLRVKETLVLDEYSDDSKDYFLLTFLSKFYFDLGEYRKAILYSERFYRVYRYFQNSIVVKSFFRIGDYGVVKSIALDMLNFEESIDVLDLRDICNTLSEVYFILGDYSSSIKYHDKLFKLFEKHKSNPNFIYQIDSLEYINVRYYFSKILLGDNELIKYKDHINKRNFLVFFKYFLKLKNPNSNIVLDNIINTFNVKRKKVV
jgi:tetratricopeptide (TPR) repeat protein